MTLFYDPTETRQGTRLHQSVIDASQQLPGLEQQTGADLLISLLKMPPLKECTNSDLSQMNLHKHCDSGLLVQRKTGRDLTSSIAKLPEILLRMKQWTTRPWLLIVADIKIDRDNNVIIDGENTQYSFGSLDGALTYWQLRGGYYSIISRDSLMPAWINGMLDRLKKLEGNREYFVLRPPEQLLIGSPRWVETLSTFPNVGHDRALKIADHCGSLWSAIEYLSDPEQHIDDIGPETIKRARQFLGYPSEDTALKLVDRGLDGKDKGE